MQRAPRICPCHLTIAHGERCPCERRRDAARQDKRPTAAARGYDSAWQRVAAAHLRLNPHCAACHVAGVTTKAQVVDHIIPVRERPDLRLTPSNLQSLCRSHNARKASIDARRSGRGRGASEAIATPFKTTAPSQSNNNPDFFTPADDKTEPWPWA